MSKLLENILKNHQNRNLLEFDMTKSGSAMMRHLGKDVSYDVINSVPIEPERPSWAQIKYKDKFCLAKTYDLHNTRFLIYFTNELIYLADKMQHHPEILIDGTQATIYLYTKDLNDVTDIDVKMSRHIDDIYEDINIINFKK